MRLRKILKLTVAVMLIFVTASLSACSGGGKTFHFASYKTNERVPYTIYFEDDYFSRPASEYNPSLAAASACLALSGFSTATTSDFSTADENAREIFSVLGFRDYLANAYGTAVPTASSFGVFIASRKLGDCTIIGITVRGAGYQMEWASNCLVGDNEKFSQGFFEASEIYLAHLKEYIERFAITGKIKIWTSGYSRGGATVNLSAGRICDGLKEGVNVLSDKVTFTKDDIYAYCFEPPAGRIATISGEDVVEKGEDYSNIKNVLNLNDLVPFVVPREFNFVRYGEDLFLPDIITDLDYSRQIETVKAKMKNLPNHANVGDYKLDEFKDESLISFLNKIESAYVNITPYVYLCNFIGVLCETFGDRAGYVSVLEKSVTELFKFVYKNISPKDSFFDLGISVGKSVLLDDINEVYLYDLQNNPDKFMQDVKPLLFKALKKFDVNVTIEDVEAILGKVVSLFLNVLFSENGVTTLRALINSNNLKILGSAHYPELLLSHITTLDPHYGETTLTVKNSFHVLKVMTEGEFELTVGGKKYVYFEEGAIKSDFVLKKQGGEYTIWLPADAEFFLTAKGAVAYELYEHNNSYACDRLIEESKANEGVEA